MDVAFAICFAVLFVLGVLIGYRIGTELGERAETAGAYGWYNLGVIAGGIAITVLLGVVGLVLLYAVPVGVIAGGLTGLKMGFGESVGPWKLVDRLLNVNPDHRRAAETGSAAARRARRAAGQKEPDLISVGGTGEKDTAGARRSRRR